MKREVIKLMSELINAENNLIKKLGFADGAKELEKQNEKWKKQGIEEY